MKEELQYATLGNYKHRRVEIVHKMEYSDNRKSENRVLLQKNYFKDTFLKFRVGPWLP